MMEEYNPIRVTQNLFENLETSKTPPKQDSDTNNYISEISTNKKIKFNTSSSPASISRTTSTVSDKGNGENTLENHFKGMFNALLILKFSLCFPMIH